MTLALMTPTLALGFVDDEPWLGADAITVDVESDVCMTVEADLVTVGILGQ
jgi:hypothetical protein